jgi:hypothetical protein
MRAFLIVGISFLLFSLIIAQDMTPLKVDEINICTSITDRVPAGADTTFSVDVEQLYCYTKISGAADTTTISHVWYLNGEEKANVSLAVKAANWRTWSSKRIPKEWIGDWKVDVVAEDGTILGSKSFKVKAASE